METSDFSKIQAEFMERVSAGVYCSMATVDRKDRPRSRMMHPIWEGEKGWVITTIGSHKSKHLARNPYVSLAYIHDREKPVYVDCKASWINDPPEKQRVWDLLKAIPPPLGYDPGLFYQGIQDPHFGLLKLTPWRIELYTLSTEPVIWRPR